MSQQRPKFHARYFMADYDRHQQIVDMEQYSQTLANLYNWFDQAGYDVVNVVPINVSILEECRQGDRTYVGDVGTSPTCAAVVVGRRRD
ncbi:hypothetical protein L4G92_08220 [Neisseria sp. ZJ106]|uniref:Uncharacterized protein n=1 Tax=Neisseria lisongii TaxID=2912188 RepID=A0ABY7RKU4_9NEIS|nr:hypothetical protein [Neisseria lisongii]MCF7522028.1 hypothetical protein [Neisseria lisongii]WCL72166.1 hypothetical protein PJU73_03400 [Neisseria lisongii]